MKGNNKIKYLASVLAFILLFQYVSVILPFLEVYAADTYTIEGITWSYTIKSSKAIINSISGKVGEKVTIPSTLGGSPVAEINSLR